VVLASDVSVRRVRRVRETADRLELRNLHAVAADALRPPFAGTFSRVLVDAPCTNTGVLGRKPDAKWRRQPSDVERLADLQGHLLDRAREHVGPGGLLVYSTCSLEPEENEDVIRAYLERHPSDAVVPVDDVLPDELVVDGCLQTDPACTPLDGAFAAVIRPGGAVPRSST
jgi:16S rRNA (cytosine967-C5)-methyltransferase